MCRECHAHKLVLSKIYTDVGPNARWRPHKRTEDEYLARMLKLGHLSKLTSIPGWSLETHRYDLMHVLFLGVCLHLCGSILVHLSDLKFWQGRTIRSRLRRAWHDFKRWTRDHGLTTSQPMFKPGNLGRGKSPHLAEMKAKAHNCKIIVYWLASLTSNLSRTHGELGAKIATATWSMAHFNWLLDQEKGWKLEPALAEELRATGTTFLLVYQSLSKWAVKARKMLYAWRPKFHYFEHMLDIMVAELLHPRLWMNWHEESLLGDSTRIASRTHRLTAPERFLDRSRHHQPQEASMALAPRCRSIIKPEPMTCAQAARAARTLPSLSTGSGGTP